MPGVKAFLEGFVDTHVHAGPTLIAREFNAWELVREAERGGFAAVVLKDHFMPTVSAARILQDHVGDRGVKIFGSLALNNSVGGLNPTAVETAIRLGARVIWMPTTSAANHAQKHRAPGTKFPSLAHAEKAGRPIAICDRNGSLTAATEEILGILAEHSEVVLATGHLSRAEVDVLVRRAFAAGVRRLVVTHPHFMVDATPGDMQDWQSLGAYLEFTAVISLPNSPLYCRPAQDVAAIIEKLDPAKIVLSSDLGLKNAGRPVEGMTTFLELLRAAGIAAAALKQMVTRNPATLLGL
ncbi:MAG: hypothetical protein JSW39_17935 [Desulfobacterales bacterium]|nr:MAG: hypothetical protein JSW39_17935 [Desulfobacterales bacterium]